MAGMVGLVEASLIPDLEGGSQVLSLFQQYPTLVTYFRILALVAFAFLTTRINLQGKLLIWAFQCIGRAQLGVLVFRVVTDLLGLFLEFAEGATLQAQESVEGTLERLIKLFDLRPTRNLLVLNASFNE